MKEKRESLKKRYYSRFNSNQETLCMLACISALGLLLNSESCHLPSVPDKAPKVRHTLKADGLGPNAEVTREWKLVCNILLILVVYLQASKSDVSANTICLITNALCKRHVLIRAFRTSAYPPSQVPEAGLPDNAQTVFCPFPYPVLPGG